jgi:hypothetical protein
MKVTMKCFATLSEDGKCNFDDGTDYQLND